MWPRTRSRLYTPLSHRVNNVKKSITTTTANKFNDQLPSLWPFNPPNFLATICGFSWLLYFCSLCLWNSFIVSNVGWMELGTVENHCELWDTMIEAMNINFDICIEDRTVNILEYNNKAVIFWFTEPRIKNINYFGKHRNASVIFSSVLWLHCRFICVFVSMCRAEEKFKIKLKISDLPTLLIIIQWWLDPANLR